MPHISSKEKKIRITDCHSLPKIEMWSQDRLENKSKCKQNFLPVVTSLIWTRSKIWIEIRNGQKKYYLFDTLNFKMRAVLEKLRPFDFRWLIQKIRPLLHTNGDFCSTQARISTSVQLWRVNTRDSFDWHTSLLLRHALDLLKACSKFASAFCVLGYNGLFICFAKL